MNLCSRILMAWMFALLFLAGCRGSEPPGGDADAGADGDVTGRGDVTPEVPGTEVPRAEVPGTDGDAAVDADAGTDHAEIPEAVADQDAGPVPISLLKVDLLFVMDSSASMSQEQKQIVNAFPAFVSALQAAFPVDLRAAVTTTNAIENGGAFAHDPATSLPPAAYEQEVAACLGNADCEQEFGAGWGCKSYPAGQMFNLNGSINSSCIFHCSSDADCCAEFCPDAQCATLPDPACSYECHQPGGGTSGCLDSPGTEDCPDDCPAFVDTQNMDAYFKCLAMVGSEQSYSANLEQGLKAAWLALDPAGPNSQQVSAFVRDDAYLLIVFVSDEDDCSIDPAFAAPNHTCQDDSDCQGCGGTCEVDWYYSEMKGEPIKLCHGCIKKDYYNICALLGDFKGKTHHECVYDLACEDCGQDSDCEPGWYCKEGKKCRPAIFSLTTIASYQNPPGAPVFSLTQPDAFHAKYLSMKKNPTHVLVAALTGDGLLLPTDKDSLISNACLDDPKLDQCQAYQQVAATAPAGCLESPYAAGCEAVSATRLECIRQCYVASKGSGQNPSTAKNSYVCAGQFGKADLGDRYRRLVEAFGDRGMAYNMCQGESFEGFAVTLAEFVRARAEADWGPCGLCGGGGYHCEADQCVCTPDCAGKECGPDGCGGQCGLGPDGACPEGALCMPDAQCCLPDCAGKECGPDDCGGSCGSCPGANGKCDLGVCACEPDCQGKECGPDGCGGQCGECGADAYCEEGICQMEVGGFLYPCTQNADCLSGFCVETPAGETVCTVQCLEDCPGGWTCKLLPDSCPDCQFVCLPV